jgi:DNA-binding winged helix-turn-helix (wHTH) protein/TolB-like protein/Tfp pilus assembly protein PilF
MNAPSPRRYAFGDFRVDALTRELHQNGVSIALTPKVFDTLLYLVRNAGVVLSKDQLLAAIWPGRIVEENNLNQTISALRRVLGASAGDHRFIVTEPGRGYRFVAELLPVDETAIDDRIPATTPEEPGTANASMHAPPVGIELRGSTTVRSHRALLAALVGLALALALIGWRAWHSATPTPTQPTTIAVLPFKPLRTEDRDEVLEMGIADTLIAKLSSTRHLVVRSLNSVRRFNRLDQDPLIAARELGVTAVLEGQIQKSAGHVRLTARLLSVPTGAALWAGTFDEKFSDVFTVQDAIAEKVAGALAVELDRAERRAMSAHYTRNTEAYELYLAGRYHIGKSTPPEIHVGIGFFRKAIELDPSYALAYAALAESYRRLPITSDVDPKEAFPLAKAAASKALELDDTLADAHSVLGWVALWYDWNWEESEKEFRRAIDLNPGVSEAHLGYGGLLSNTGRNAQALEEASRGRELEPTSPVANTVAANYLAAAGQSDEARRLLAKALAIEPNFWIAHLTLGWLDLAADRNDEAIAEFIKARDASGGSVQAVSMIGFALARTGKTAEARSLVGELEARAQTHYTPATSIATIYAGLGEADPAIEWLQRAYDERDVRMSFLRVDRRWDALRADPRFVAIARRMRLE